MRLSLDSQENLERISRDSQEISHIISMRSHQILSLKTPLRFLNENSTRVVIWCRLNNLGGKNTISKVAPKRWKKSWATQAMSSSGNGSQLSQRTRPASIRSASWTRCQATRSSQCLVNWAEMGNWVICNWKLTESTTITNYIW